MTAHRDRIARELYRRLHPGSINMHDSERTAETDAFERDRAYRDWDEGRAGPAHQRQCYDIADALLAAGIGTHNPKAMRSRGPRSGSRTPVDAARPRRSSPMAADEWETLLMAHLWHHSDEYIAHLAALIEARVQQREAAAQARALRDAANDLGDEGWPGPAAWLQKRADRIEHPRTTDA